MKYAVFIEWRNETYRYATPSTGRNLWAKSTAQRFVRDNTLTHQVARLVPETELSKWVVGKAD